LYLSQVAEIVQISVKDKQQSLFLNKFEPLKRTPTRWVLETRSEDTKRNSYLTQNLQIISNF
jgi:hypothetical protein